MYVISYTQVICVDKKEQSNIYDNGNTLATMIFLTDLIGLIRPAWMEKAIWQINYSYISRTGIVGESSGIRFDIRTVVRGSITALFSALLPRLERKIRSWS